MGTDSDSNQKMEPQFACGICLTEKPQLMHVVESCQCMHAKPAAGGAQQLQFRLDQHLFSVLLMSRRVRTDTGALGVTGVMCYFPDQTQKVGCCSTLTYKSLYIPNLGRMRHLLCVEHGVHDQ